MVLIQFDIPKKLDKELSVLSITSELKDKRKVILFILTKYFKDIDKFVKEELNTTSKDLEVVDKVHQ